jgi:hypothetical protein
VQAAISLANPGASPGLPNEHNRAPPSFGFRTFWNSKGYADGKFMANNVAEKMWEWLTSTFAAMEPAK